MAAVTSCENALYGAVLVSKLKSHFIIIHLVCAPKLLHNLCFFLINLDILQSSQPERGFLRGQTIMGDGNVQMANKSLCFLRFP